MNKEPGDWYGVNSIAQVLTSLFSNTKDKRISESLAVLNFSEGHLYMDQIMEKIREGFKAEQDMIISQYIGREDRNEKKKD